MKNISGVLNGKSNINGKINVTIPVNGHIARGTGFKELKFLPRDDFPPTGNKSLLYIDIDNNDIYYWDNEYLLLTDSKISKIINDMISSTDSTWSSDKINKDIINVQKQIDNIGDMTPLSNSDIYQILMS